ncbi:MAG: cytochrome c3 family protein, partial [Thermoguttaceae bacterium]
QGLRCTDCHGGNSQTEEVRAAHATEDGFHKVASPKDVPEFCGKCHANIEYMRRYRPSPRTDQLAEYWTSGHGQKLKAAGDPNVATCISCHDRPHGSGQEKAKHGIRPVTEMDSPVYRTRVAKTCSTCHSDKKLMAGRQYHGQPLPCDEYDKWTRSVHGKALLEKGDLSAPTCNNCHGNHGAVPPQVDSVANACGTCHGKVAKLFADTRMKHKFESEGLPGCATCHGNHEIVRPSDEMLGMEGGTFCARCHQQGKFGATIAGADVAKRLRGDLDRLKEGIDSAQDTLTKAARLGMEVSQPQFRLRNAFDALTNARSLVHTFQPEPVEKALDEGLKVVSEVQEKGEHALEEYTTRRIWLAASLAPILLVIVLLLLYIRAHPAPKSADPAG